MAFRLLKRYVDVVTEDGAVAIGYWAELRLGTRLTVAAVDTWNAVPAGVEPQGRWRVGRLEGPRFLPGEARWDEPRLPVVARWTARCPGYSRRLYSAGRGAVDWRCLVPAADAELALGPSGPSLRGTGYAEEIELGLAPWALPIAVLRWGRFVGTGSSVTWLRWEGGAPLTIVLVDGRPAEEASVTDDLVRWRQGALRLEPRQTLRDAPLGAGTLSAVPRLLRIAPPAIVAAHETKWLSTAHLHTDLGGSEVGLAIHESVRFPVRAAARRQAT